MSRIAVTESILHWALERSARTTDDLKGKFPKIGQWLSGEVQPTLAQLEKFAKATHTPFGFLFLNKPPEEEPPISCFRTVGDTPSYRPSTDLLDTIYLMERRQWWMRDYLIDQGHDPLPFVGSAATGDEIKATAEKIREILGFDLQWAKTQPTWKAALDMLRKRMGQAGILVFSNGVVGNNTHRKLDVSEFRGFVLVDEYAPLVFVNNTDGKAAQMFTLAHELAHVFYGSSAAFDLRQMQPADDPTEQTCNRVAAEFLVPEDALRQVWPDVRDSREPFQALAQHFKVSAIVAARRVLDMELIRRSDFFEFYQKWKNERMNAATPATGGDFYNTQNSRLDYRFSSSVIREVKSGRMSYIEAYRLTQLYGKTFEEYASRLNLGDG